MHYNRFSVRKMYYFEVVTHKPSTHLYIPSFAQSLNIPLKCMSYFSQLFLFSKYWRFVIVHSFPKLFLSPDVYSTRGISYTRIQLNHWAQKTCLGEWFVSLFLCCHFILLGFHLLHLNC